MQKDDVDGALSDCAAFHVRTFHILSPILWSTHGFTWNLPDWRSPYIALQCLVLKPPEDSEHGSVCQHKHGGGVSVKGFFLQPSNIFQPTQKELRISQIRLLNITLHYYVLLHIWFPSICITKSAKPLSARWSWSSLAVSICILQCLDFLGKTWMLVWNTLWKSLKHAWETIANYCKRKHRKRWACPAWDFSASQFTDPRGIEIFKVPGGTW